MPSIKCHLKAIHFYLVIFCSVVVLIKLENESSQNKQEIALIPWIDLAQLSVVSEVSEDDDDIEELRLKLLGSNKEDPVQVDAKQVQDWLEKHHIEVSIEKNEAEDSTISIEGGLVRLRPPYLTEDSCIEASNVIVLDRVTSILAQMPASSGN